MDKYLRTTAFSLVESEAKRFRLRKTLFFSLLDYFYKTWSEYQIGFGTPGEEHWLGLDAIFALTQAADYELRITVELLSGDIGVANYDVFRLTENVSS